MALGDLLHGVGGLLGLHSSPGSRMPGEALAFRAVSVGRMDIAVGAITMNGAPGAERNKSMDFSNPYYLSNQGILKRANDNRAYCAAAVCTVAELNTTTLKIGAQAITTSEFWVEDNLKNVVDAKHLELRPTVDDTLLLLSQGVVDIVVRGRPIRGADGTASPRNTGRAGSAAA